MNRDSIFRQVALDRLAAPERLDERLSVVPPRAWLAFAALAALLAGVGAWAFLGRVPVTVTGEGVFVSPEEATLFIPIVERRRVQPAMTALVSLVDADHPEPARRGVVTLVATDPATPADLARVFADETQRPRGTVASVTVTLAGADAIRGAPCTVRIVVGERRPAALLFAH